MLQTVDFNITAPSAYRFLERFTKLDRSDALVFNLARYLIELTVIDLKMYRFTPSLIAASGLYAAKKILRRPNAWSIFMGEHTYQNDKSIRECAKELCTHLEHAHEKRDF